MNIGLTSKRKVVVMNNLIEIGACDALINKIQTTVDGGARITLDINPDNLDLIKKLFDIKFSQNGYVYVGFTYATD